MPVASPKFKEFAAQYLHEDGSIRPDILSQFQKFSCIKEVKVSYDHENSRWGFDVITTDMVAVARSPTISRLPCRILSPGMTR